MLKLRIKASQITNLTDARYFAALGVEWLGYSLDPAAQNYIPPLQLRTIREWVEGPVVVGEFGLQAIEEISEAVRLLDVEAVQVNQYVDLISLKKLVDLPLIQEQVIERTADLPGLFASLQGREVHPDIYLLDFEKNGISWEHLSDSAQFSELLDWCARHKTILALSAVSAADINSIANIHAIYGVQLRGGPEEKTGIKSFEEFDDIFDVLMLEE